MNELAWPRRDFLVLAKFEDGKGNIQISTYNFGNKDERKSFALRSMDMLLRGWTVTTCAAPVGMQRSTE